MLDPDKKERTRIQKVGGAFTFGWRQLLIGVAIATSLRIFYKEFIVPRLAPDAVVIDEANVREGADYLILDGSKGHPSRRSLTKDELTTVKSHGGEIRPSTAAVTVKASKIARKVVTVGEYIEFLASNSQFSMPSPPSWNPGWKRKDMPMVNVKAGLAAAYARWHGGYIPSFDELIAAAYNEPSSDEYPTGGDAFRPQMVVCSVMQHRLSPIGENDPSSERYRSPRGIYHVMGNVFVWTSDIWPTSDDQREVFGGSYLSDTAGDFRRSVRSHRESTHGFEDVGIRIAFKIDMGKG